MPQKLVQLSTQLPTKEVTIQHASSLVIWIQLSQFLEQQYAPTFQVREKQLRTSPSIMLTAGPPVSSSYAITPNDHTSTAS